MPKEYDDGGPAFPGQIGNVSPGHYATAPDGMPWMDYAAIHLPDLYVTKADREYIKQAFDMPEFPSTISEQTEWWMMADARSRYKKATALLAEKWRLEERNEKP
jgi:hypothetical protein